MRFIVQSMLVYLFFLHFSYAADPGCQSSKTQREASQCASGELDLETKKINRIYGEYRERLNDVQKQQLREAQLAWIKFRDLDCKFKSSGVEGGSAYGMVMAGCLAEKTRIRIKELEAMSTCEEGDLSCAEWK